MMHCPASQRESQRRMIYLSCYNLVTATWQIKIGQLSKIMIPKATKKGIVFTLNKEAANHILIKAAEIKLYIDPHVMKVHFYKADVNTS